LFHQIQILLINGGLVGDKKVVRNFRAKTASGRAFRLHHKAIWRRLLSKLQVTFDAHITSRSIPSIDENNNDGWLLANLQTAAHYPGCLNTDISGFAVSHRLAGNSQTLFARPGLPSGVLLNVLRGRESLTKSASLSLH